MLLGAQTARTETEACAVEIFLLLFPRLTAPPFLSYPAGETKLVDGRAGNGDTALPDEPRLWPHCECGRAFTTDLPSLAASASTS